MAVVEDVVDGNAIEASAAQESLSITAGASAAGGSRTSSRGRLLLEFCWGPRAYLGQQCKFPDDECVVVRLVEEQDMTTQSGINMHISN